MCEFAPSSPEAKLPILVWHWGRHGGGPHYTLELARQLAARNDVELYLSLSRQAEIYRSFDGLARDRIDLDTYAGYLSAIAATRHLPRIRRQLRAFLQKHRIRTVVCTMSHLWNAAVASQVRAAGARYILIVHDAAAHPGEFLHIPEVMLRSEMRQADHIITLSEHVRDEVCARNAIPLNRVTVMSHGTFSSTLVGGGERTFPIGRGLKLLCFGRMRTYKGLDLLLEAFADARVEVPTLELKLAGEGSLGRLKRRARSLGVEIDNRYIPENEIPSILSGADVMVLPYREASQSGVAMLAYGARIPVIATPVGGLKEQVRDRETGLVAHSATASALARCIVELSSDPNLYAHCSRGAAREGEARSDWSSIAASIRNLAQVDGFSEPSPVQGGF